MLGSRITRAPKAMNYDWDVLIWIMYDKNHVIQEAWDTVRLVHEGPTMSALHPAAAIGL